MADGGRVDREEARRIAELARLELPDDDLAALAAELSGLLATVETIADLDLDGVPPFAHATDAEQPLREDVVTPGLTPDEALANAPRRDDTAFVVPRVVG